MNKKIVSLGLVSCFAVMSLASCGGREAPIRIPEVNVNTMEELKAYVAEHNNKEIQLKFWHPFGSEAEKNLKAQVENFNNLYDGLIEVTLEKKGGYGELKKAVTLEITNGHTPNIVVGYPDHFAEYLSGGIMVPLNKYMESTDPEIGIGAGAKDVKNDFLPNYMAENNELYDGYTFGLPFNKSTELAYYNKTLYTEFDIPTPEEEPYTWQNMKAKGLEIKQKLDEANVWGKVHVCTKPGNEGKKLDFTSVTKEDFVPFTSDSAANLFITLVRDFGGVYTERGENVRKGYVKFDSPEVKAAINLMKDLSESKVFWTCEQFNTDHGNKVTTNFQAAYTFGSSGGAHYNVHKEGFYDTGVALMPYFDDGTTTRKYVIQQGTNLAILGNATDIERTASWLVLRFLTAYHKVEGTGENMKVTDPNATFAQNASYLPVRTSGRVEGPYRNYLGVYESEDFDSLSAKDAILLEAAVKAVSYGEDWIKFTDPAFVGSSKVRDVADTILPAILGGKLTAEKGIADAYKQLKTFVKK